jgi:hypothetical protein
VTISLLSLRADFPEHAFDPIQRYSGIEAWSEWALIENAVDGQWSGVLNAAGEVSFACNGYDEVGTGLDHYAARNGSSGRNRHLHAVFFRKLQKVLYAALATAFAILHPVSDLHLAVLVLETMGHEEQNGMRRPSVAAPREDKFVVHGHKCMLDLLAPKPRQLAYPYQDRQKELDRETPELQGKRDIVAKGENGDEQPEASEQHGADQCRYDPHYRRKVDRDSIETVVRNCVEQDQDRGGNDSEKNGKGNYYPLFRTGGRLVEIKKGFLLRWFALFAH